MFQWGIDYRGAKSGARRSSAKLLCCDVGNNNREEIGHDQNSRFDSGLAQGDSLLYVADGEPADAFTDEHAGDLDGAVAVRVGFYDRQYFDAVANCFADAAVVGGYLVA